MKQIIHYDKDKLGQLCCDNPQCDYESPDMVGISESQIDTPCPKCGQNLLTRDGYDRAVKLIKMADTINKVAALFGLGSEPGQNFKSTTVSVRPRPNGVTDIRIEE